MIRVTIPKEPYWIEMLAELRVRVRPVTRVEQAAARAYARRKVAELAESKQTLTAAGGDVEGMPDINDPDIEEAMVDLFYAQGLGRKIILEWEGPADPQGKPLEVSPEAIDEFMRLPYIGDLFVAKVQEHLEKLFAEGNASGPAPDGSSATGLNTAADAGRSTPPAATGEKGKTGSTARSSSTSRKQTSAGKHGDSSKAAPPS